MYRIVASDMDQTFLDENHSIPAANIEALRKMKEAGVLFVPASGRAYDSIMFSLAKVQDLLEGSYVLSYNGNCVNRVGSTEPLTFTELPYEKLKQIYDWGLEHEVGFHIYELSGTCWASHISDEERDYLRGHMPITEFDDDSLSFLQGHPVAKMLYMNPNLDYLHELSDSMPAEVLEGVSTTFSSKRYLEFNPAGVCKSVGLTRLAEQLGIPMSEVIACGDAANDADMIEAAGLGVVVSNATDDVRAIADYEANSSCNDGILAEVAEKFLGL